MKYSLGIIRLLISLILIVLFLPILWLTGVVSKKPKIQFVMLKNWSKFMMYILGIRTKYSGHLPQEGMLILPNHRSYIDVTFFLSNLPTSFLSKISVKKWPFIGWAAQMLKTVFVDRNNPNSRKVTKETIRDRLVSGNSIVVFPEGTTSKAPKLLPLKKGMFHVAAEEYLPVLPVVIEYKEVKDAWDGKESFLSHFVKSFSKWKTHVRVEFGEVVRCTNPNFLHSRVTSWMKSRLAEMQHEWGHDF